MSQKDPREQKTAISPDPFLRAWRGQAPLGRVFWLYGVAASWAMILSYLAVFADAPAGTRQVVLLAFAAYTAWVLVAVWRCSDVHRSLFDLLARALTIAWAFNAALVLLALELQLLL